jgi:hypothetical protein
MQLSGDNGTQEIDARKLERAVYSQVALLRELFVHLYDYILFYGTRDEEYVEGIWRSWATVPGLERNIHEYVLRTLCAVSLSLVGSKGAVGDAIGRLVTELEKARAKAAGAVAATTTVDALTRAIDHIKKSRAVL